MLCLVTQSCPTLWDPMDCSPPGSSIHGVFQTRILEQVAISFSGGWLWPRIELVSLASPALAGRFFTTGTTWEAHQILRKMFNKICASPVHRKLQSTAEIKKTKINGQRHHIWVRRLPLIKLSIFPKLIYGFNIVPVKTPAGNFVETDKLFLKFTCKAKNARYQNNSQKERTERYITWFYFKQKNF